MKSPLVKIPNIVYLFQVSQGQTATATSMTVPVTSAKMEELVSMGSTPTTVSVNQNLQVCKVLLYNTKSTLPSKKKKTNKKPFNLLYEYLAFHF